MKKLLPHLLWLSGFLVMFIGIALGPGVPYQDPTPEMQAKELREDQRSMAVAAIGLGLFTIGVIWGSSRWLVRRCSRDNHHSSIQA